MISKRISEGIIVTIVIFNRTSEGIIDTIVIFNRTSEGIIDTTSRFARYARFATSSCGGLRTRLRRVRAPPAFGRWRAHRPAASGQVHGRFAPEKKPACGRWAGTRALRSRKETGLNVHG